jgi:hypothetical protein
VQSEDLDGWLARANHPIPAPLVDFLAQIQGLRTESGGDIWEVQILLNSGKPPEYLEEQARRFGARYVLSGNGAAWRAVGGETRRVVPITDDFRRFRAALGLGADEVDVVRLGPPVNAEMALEGKRDRHGDIGISFFPEPDTVPHRWQFAGGVDRHQLRAGLREVIAREGLALEVPPPHADGAVDVLPLLADRPVGKWTLADVARTLWPHAELRLSHGGDAPNDLSAMEHPDVRPLTAATTVIAPQVQALGGVVAPGDPGLAALRHCYAALADLGWYGPLSPVVARLTAG